MRTLLISLAAISLTACGTSVKTSDTENLMETNTSEKPVVQATENHLWLEEVEGKEALEWVEAQNTRSLAALQADPRYATFEAEALDLLTSSERIPYGSVRQGFVYNFWQDDTHVRGIWRRTPEADYAKTEPVWETLIDFDALAADEGKNWVYKGVDCFAPHGTSDYRCLVSLSDGGKDAVIVREFDLSSKEWVADGFVTTEAKQDVSWIDQDTVLIATDWGEGTVTESGYPYIVKRWTRGTPISEAVEVIRGDVTDVGVWPMVIELEDGTRLQGAVEADTFFTSSYFWFPDGEAEAVKLPLPAKSSINGIYKGQMLVTLNEDWDIAGADKSTSQSFKTGDLVAFDFASFRETRELPEVGLVFRPTAEQAVNGVGISKSAALLSINENVVGKVLRLDLTDGKWTTAPVTLPGTGQASILFADQKEEAVFIGYEGFLTPDSLLKYDASANRISTLKSLSSKFDADNLTVEQKFATSKDGTKVPYFIVHQKDLKLDGTTPTLLYGYGGFQVSMTPGYSPVTGKLWLENGGAYVLANIRGGGEFGPSWHQAGLKLKRQRIYDDFIAVGEDLVRSEVTSPEHLGIMGGSNGGLLMGVMLNQRPDLWNAVIVQVPLLDMLRYHKLLAGASWVDEYGSPDVPEERAFLETISPYHNFDASKPYPEPFFVTSTKDDRVHPGHARKMAKLFEEAGLPFLYYENTDGGHSAAANQTERAKRTALEYVYLSERLGME